MFLERVGLTACITLAVACAPQRVAVSRSEPQSIPTAEGWSESARAPDFEVFAPGGVRYSSKTLIGKQPFVALFFATWCDYCQGELAAMQRALRETGPLPIIPVSVDGPETWERVPAYLAAFGIREPAVRALHYRAFATTYNPADILPSVAIVGRNGVVIDYLRGYDPAHDERLLTSLRLAKALPPADDAQLGARLTPPR